MDVESRSLVALHHHGRIPYEIGSFHLDDHDVQEWSEDHSIPGMKHRARKEVGKWIDADKNANVTFQRREDSKHSDNSREQQRTEVIQGNAPDANFQIVRSQRHIQDSDESGSGRVTTMSTSYQISSSRGVRSTSKTTSTKTTSTKTVSGVGQNVDFENLKMTFQPLLNNVARERINVSRNSGTRHRRPPTRRHTPAALSSSSLDETSGRGEIIEEILDDDEDDFDSSVKISEIHTNSNSSSTSQSHSKVTDVPISIIGFKNISPKIRVGFPVEIQLELKSKLNSNGDQSHIITELNDDDDDDDNHNNIGIIESPKLLSSSTSTLSASNTTLTSSSSTINLASQQQPQSQQATTTNSMDTNNFRTSSTSSSSKNKLQKIQEQKSIGTTTKTTKITEAEHSHESIIDENDESANVLFNPSSLSSTPTTLNNSIANNNTNINHSGSNGSNDLTFDFNYRRKSYGFESFDPNNTSEQESVNRIPSPEKEKEEEKEKEAPLNRHIRNSNSTSNPISNMYSSKTSSNSNNNSTTTITNSSIRNSQYERPSFHNLTTTTKLSPSSRSWDLIQNETTAQQRRANNKKLFASSSDLENLNTGGGSSYNNNHHHYQHQSKTAPQKTIITLNAFEEKDEPDVHEEYTGVKRRLSHEFTLDSLESFPNPGIISSNSKNSRRSVSSDNIQKAHIDYPPDVIYHNIHKESDLILPSSSSSDEKSQKKMLNETPDLLNKMSYLNRNLSPPSNNNTETIEDIKSTWNKNNNNSINNKQDTLNTTKRINKTNKYNIADDNDDEKEVENSSSYLNNSLSRILSEGKDSKVNNNNSTTTTNNNYRNSKYAFGNTTTTSLLRGDGDSLDKKTEDPIKDGGGFSHYNYKDNLHLNSDILSSNRTGNKQTNKVSQTWISTAIDPSSQTARDTDVTTSISGTNDPMKKTQKRVEFCKTEVHFTPESGKFQIVETDDNKPSTVHLFRRKRKNDKKSSTNSVTTEATTLSKKSIEISEKLNKINQEQNGRGKEEKEEEEKGVRTNFFNASSSSSSSTAHTSSSQHSINNISNSGKTGGGVNGDDEGLELVKKKKSAKADECGGVVIGGGVAAAAAADKKSLFHRTRDHQIKPNYERLRAFDDDGNDKNNKDGDNNNILSSGALAEESLFPLLPTLKSRNIHHDVNNDRDSKKLVPDDFNVDHDDDDELIHSAQKESIINGDHYHHYLHHNNDNTKLITDLLGEGTQQEEEEGDDESRQDMILSNSNYGELKTLRYLKQLKKNKQQQQKQQHHHQPDYPEWEDRNNIYDKDGTESPIDFLQQLGGDPDQEVDDEEGIIDDQDDFEDSSKQFPFDNVLYENGSFVPLATRRCLISHSSLIEMNNRKTGGRHIHNSKNNNNNHVGGSRHSHTSDNSSTTTSNYSLPHSDRESNNALKLMMTEGSISEEGLNSSAQKSTSADLRFTLDKDMLNSTYFSEPVKRNFKIPKSDKHKRGGDNDDDDDDDNNKGKEQTYDFPTPVQPAQLRSLPPYNKNGRFSSLLPPSIPAMTTTIIPAATKQTRDGDIITHSKPPMPILPSQFSSFEKTGAALRERSNAKNSQTSFASNNYNNTTTTAPNNNNNTVPETFESYHSKNRRLAHNNTDTLSTSTTTTTTTTEPTYIPSKSIVNIGGNDTDDMDSLSTARISEETELGIDGITISPEPMLSRDHTYKGPAYFDNPTNNLLNSTNNNSTGNKSVVRSLTFPKSHEPEWVSKARSRESRMKDWSLIGKQYGTTTTRKSEPPWISEIRVKSKPAAATTEEIQSLPKISAVYPWNTTSQPGTTITELNTENELYKHTRSSSSSSNINNHYSSRNQIETLAKENIRSTSNNAIPLPPRNLQEAIHSLNSNETTDDSEFLAAMKRKKKNKKLLEELPIPKKINDYNHEDIIISDKIVGSINQSSKTLKSSSTEYSSTTNNSSNKNILDMNRDSDSIFIKSDQIPSKDILDGSLGRKDKKLPPLLPSSSSSTKQYPAVIIANITTDYSEDHSIDKKLLAPLTESTKQSSRKPLSSSSANKNIIINNDNNNNNSPNNNNNSHENNQNNNNDNSKLPPRAAIIRPPRPPKPPQRVSSLPKQPMASNNNNKRISSNNSNNNFQNNHHHNSSSNNNTNNSDVDEAITSNSSISATRVNGTTPIFRHPLVKVAKIPTTASSFNSKSSGGLIKELSSSPDGKSTKNKAKNNVTYETKLKVQSKLMEPSNGTTTSHKDRLSKVSPTSRTATTTTTVSLSSQRKR